MKRVAMMCAALLAATAAGAQQADLGQTQGQAPSLSDYGAALQQTAYDTEAGDMTTTPPGTIADARQVLSDLDQAHELPDFPPGYGALPAKSYARTALLELGKYSDALAAMSGGGDPRYKEMSTIATGSRNLLAQSYVSMDEQMAKLTKGEPAAWQIVMRMLLVVSGNKTTAALALAKDKELAKSVKAMKPQDGAAGRPTKGQDVKIGQLRPDIPENELRLVAALRDRLAEVHKKVASADMAKGEPPLQQVKAQNPAARIGELDADARARAADHIAWDNAKDGAGAADALRDAPNSAPITKPEVDKAVKGLDRMQYRGTEAQASLEKVTAPGGDIDRALDAIELCSRMSLGAVQAAQQSVDKNKESNQKLDELGRRWDQAAAQTPPDIAAMKQAETEAKQPISDAKDEELNARDAAKGAFMANQRAMRSLRQAVAAITAASRDLGLKESALPAVE